MKKLKGIFELLRIELPFAAGICVVMGQLLALGEFASFRMTLTGFLAVFSISASILTANDYFDVETDKVNAPHRPIPSNKITPTEALILSVFLLSLGAILSLSISISVFLMAVILLIIGFLYNRKFKKSGLPGNLMVSFSVGMTFIFGAASVGLPYNNIAFFFAVIVALIDLGEEIAADAMDEKGDRLINSRSLAIRFGRKVALRVSGFIFLAVIILSIVPFVLGWFNLIYLFPILVLDFFIAYSTLKLLKTEDDAGRIHIRRIYLGGTFGLVIFLLMRLAGL